MKKILIALLMISLFFVTGCNDVSKENMDDIFNSILFLDSNLSNTNMEGYSLYIPHGVKLVDKNDFNLVLKDQKNIYYLYIDTIAYYYKTRNAFNESSNHYVSKKINYNGKEGYIDVKEENGKYLVVLMYNYSKIESYIEKEDLQDAIISMSTILSSIKYNSTIIEGYIDKNNNTFQEEKFNVFKSGAEDDNFLKYEKEFGTYKDEIIINNDDVIEIDEFIE